MKYNKIILCIFIILIIYLIHININKGYISYLPSLHIYPNNCEDLELMKNIMKTRTQEDIDYFFKTNVSVVYAFLPYVNETETENELTKITTSQNHIIMFFKKIINRRRPYQIDTNLKPLSTLTSQTPAYPAGHAYQALVLSSYLSKKYPEKKELFEILAYKCNECRIKAGIHYKSDGDFSKKLFNFFNR